MILLIASKKPMLLMLNCLDEVILISTYDIGIYDDLTKHSSNTHLICSTVRLRLRHFQMAQTTGLRSNVFFLQFLGLIFKSILNGKET